MMLTTDRLERSTVFAFSVRKLIFHIQMVLSDPIFTRRRGFMESAFAKNSKVGSPARFDETTFARTV